MIHTLARCLMASGMALSALATASSAAAIKHVFVIAMENTDAEAIYGNVKRAPYINNQLLPRYAHATAFDDTALGDVPSEPHYVMMEAGTNVFADHVFTDNGDASAENSTASTAHLTAQLKQAGISWMTYQEGIDASTGTCPIESDGRAPYAAKHNPFVFFRDISGNPPDKANAYCTAHAKPYSALANDLSTDNIASYVFITPNECHDMHDDCGGKTRIRGGDDWLAAELPRLIDWSAKHQGAIFLVWDEGRATQRLPFLAIGEGVKPGHADATAYSHASLVKSVEAIFGPPALPAVAAANDFSGLFKPGAFP